jgi:hypothetical protein
MTKPKLTSPLDQINDNLKNSKLRPSNEGGKFLPCATQLVPILLKRSDHEGICHRPICAVCGKVILDLDSANVVVVSANGPAWNSPLPSLGEMGGGEAFRLGGISVFVHHGCDNQRWVPWVRATSVLHEDQRHPLEKLGFAVGL